MMARVFEGHYVGGAWTATAGRFADFNPADGLVWAEVPDGGRQDAHQVSQDHWQVAASLQRSPGLGQFWGDAL